MQTGQSMLHTSRVGRCLPLIEEHFKEHVHKPDGLASPAPASQAATQTQS